MKQNRVGKIIHIEMEKECIDDVLKGAGYKKHWDKKSYILDLYNKKRFHIHPNDAGFTFHLDRTSDNNKHFVANWWKMIGIELKRIKKIYNGHRVSIEKKRLKRSAIELKRAGRLRMQKVEYAKNALELQRNINKLT